MKGLKLEYMSALFELFVAQWVVLVVELFDVIIKSV